MGFKGETSKYNGYIPSCPIMYIFGKDKAFNFHNDVYFVILKYFEKGLAKRYRLKERFRVVWG